MKTVENERRPLDLQKYLIRKKADETTQLQIQATLHEKMKDDAEDGATSPKGRTLNPECGATSPRR